LTREQVLAERLPALPGRRGPMLPVEAASPLAYFNIVAFPFREILEPPSSRQSTLQKGCQISAISATTLVST